MKYDNLRAFEKHLEGAKSYHFSPLYFILGKDPFECGEAIRLLLNYLLPQEEKKELAITRYEAPLLEEKELGTILYTPSFFSKSPVIWIQQAEKLKKSLQEELEKYFVRPLPSQYLILSASGWLKSTSFYKNAEKEGIILEFAELKPWEKEQRLVEWVGRQIASERKVISFPVCQAFVKRIGTDQALLKQEIDKLLCYCGEKKDITLQDVEAICTKQPNESIWQLGEAIFRRETGNALQILNALLTDGQGLLPLLRNIRTQFQNLLQMCLLLAQGREGEIGQEFPHLKGQILEKQIRHAQQYGLDACKNGLLTLDETENRLKNSSIDEKLLAELLIFKLRAP